MSNILYDIIKDIIVGFISGSAIAYANAKCFASGLPELPL